MKLKKSLHSAFLFLVTGSFCVSAQPVAGGWGHSLFICADSTVMSSGLNSSGGLGNGTNADSNLPVAVLNLTGVIDVAGGFHHSLALKNDSTVWAWGGNSNGQLGNGTNVNSNIPVQVTAISGITDVEGGVNHSMALRSDSTVWTWGTNTYGELGNGTTTDSNLPVMVGLTGVTAIAGGTWHSLAIRSDSTVWAWGNNGNGELGDGTNTNSIIPVQVSGLTGVVAVSGGQHFSVALKNDGTVWSWGDNNFHQLGTGNTADSNVPVQALVSGITSISKGGFQLHMTVIKNDSTIWTWGLNDYGALGNGTTTATSTPFQLAGMTGVAMAAVGNVHTIILKYDGTIWDWGWGFYGQLGIGSNTDMLVPQLPSSLCQGPAALPVASFEAASNLCPGTCTGFVNTSTNAISYQWFFQGAAPLTSTDENPVNICYNTPGTYDVTLIASNPVSSDTLLLLDYITVFPFPPSLGIIQIGDTLFADNGFMSYQWFFNGDTIPGAVNSFYIAPQSGDYSVVCLDYNGCSAEAVVLNVIAEIPGVTGFKGITVYPNPAVDKINVRLSEFENSNVTFSIHDAVGRSVIEADRTSEETNSIDVRHLSPGVYNLEVQGSKKVWNVQFVKQ